jgi:hypothetical protein
MVSDGCQRLGWNRRQEERLLTPVEICRALLTANIPAESVPELRDEDVLQEVRDRLAQVGCELIYSRTGECWITRASGPVPELERADSPNSLDAKDLAVLAVCWLHLRFLPSENSDDEADVVADGLFADRSTVTEVPFDSFEVREQIPSLPIQSINIALGKLKRARFLTERTGQYIAGPMMDAVDEVRATEQARRLLLRHQRIRRVRHGEDVHASSDADPETSVGERGVDGTD